MSATTLPPEPYAIDPVAEKRSKIVRLLGKLTWGIVLLYLAYTISLLYIAGETTVGACATAFLALVVYVYTQAKTYTYRYLLPGLATFAFFIIFPILYSFSVSFENFSTNNMLSFELTQKYFLSESEIDKKQKYAFKLIPGTTPDTFQAFLTHKKDKNLKYLSAPFKMGTLDIVSLEQIQAAPETKALTMKSVIKNRAHLKTLKLTTNDGKNFSMTGLREFAPRKLIYEQESEEVLVNTVTGERLIANHDIGFFETEEGKRMNPGFRTYIGFANYTKIFGDPDYVEPFIEIFVWTIGFALLTTALVLGVGVSLGVLLNWEDLKYRSFYRVLLILPYAVPSFLSILIFKGLFNENFGEINTILNVLFGIKPTWFSTTGLARTMILIVNTWLGYPYFMILTLGLVQSIPKSLYEAANIDGSGPISNYFRITLPLIIKPLTPLIISSFAFNFNNFNLIFLLTRGKPDMVGTAVPAGTTDLLVSYSYRVAFLDGLDFSTGSAISTVIFLCVGVIAIIQLKLSKANKPIDY